MSYEVARKKFYNYQKGRFKSLWLYEIWEKAFDRLVEELHQETH